MTHVTFDELESAFMWAASAGGFDNRAYVSTSTGEIFCTSDDSSIDDEVPENLEDEALYVPIPDKHELDLGKNLVLNFIYDNSQADLKLVLNYFGHKGAYSRLKDLLEQRGLLDKWHEYERLATKSALLKWAEENGIAVAVPGA